MVSFLQFYFYSRNKCDSPQPSPTHSTPYFTDFWDGGQENIWPCNSIDRRCLYTRTFFCFLPNRFVGSPIQYLPTCCCLVPINKSCTVPASRVGSFLCATQCERAMFSIKTCSLVIPRPPLIFPDSMSRSLCFMPCLYTYTLPRGDKQQADRQAKETQPSPTIYHSPQGDDDGGHKLCVINHENLISVAMFLLCVCPLDRSMLYRTTHYTLSRYACVLPAATNSSLFLSSVPL